MQCNDDTHDENSSTSTGPFPRDTIAYSTNRVVSLGRPILAVAHDHYGEWQVLHGDLEPDDEMAQICMACAVKRDPSLTQLSDLPVGWIATRKSQHKPWKREQLEKPNDPIWVRFLSLFYEMYHRSTKRK
jgi:hypothetical protein